MVAKGFSVTRYRAQITALFPRSSTSDFLRSNDNTMLVYVVTIVFDFSVMRVAYKIGVMRLPP